MTPARAKRAKPSRTGWWIALGIGLALLALWSLVTDMPGSAPQSEHGAAPSGEIDDASRAKLREILREADRDEDGGGG